MSILKGITWDHPRGFQPLRAVAEIMRQKTDTEVIWDVRTLKEFGDLPIERLIGLYDLIIIDHPYMGEAAENKFLLPLNLVLDAEFINMQKNQSIGHSFQSYKFDGQLWALPIDVAGQVSAYRRDLVEFFGWTIPKDLEKLSEAASELPKQKKIGIPLCETDIWCVFLSLCAQYGGENFFDEDGIDESTGEWALEQLRSWQSFLFKDSFKMNPIQMLDHMSVEDDIVYIPFTFGYTNYARKNTTKKRIKFCDVPLYNHSNTSSLLGGAGLAISAKTEHLKECILFMRLVLSAEIQRTTYYLNGGQPAHLNAWLDTHNNTDCCGFFSDTLSTMKHAYTRPRFKGFNRFQESAAHIVHRASQGLGLTSIEIKSLNILFKKNCL